MPYAHKFRPIIFKIKPFVLHNYTLCKNVDTILGILYNYKTEDEIIVSEYKQGRIKKFRFYRVVLLRIMLCYIQTYSYEKTTIRSNIIDSGLCRIDGDIRYVRSLGRGRTAPLVHCLYCFFGNTIYNSNKQ